MGFRTIQYRKIEKTGVITLNRPEKRNALSADLLQELSRCLKDISSEKSVKIVIIQGAGEHFCAGHDINEMVNKELSDIRKLFKVCTEMMSLIQNIPQPVIAQVKGIATAAGCQLVAACDLAVAEEGARFATPGVRIGLFCSTPMVPLSRAVGRKRAMEMLLTGRFISAREALDYGLINRVVSEENLEEETWQLARDISRYSSNILGMGKRAFYSQINMDDYGAYDYTSEVISSNAVMPEAKEGMTAFLEKREPEWND